MGRWHHNFNALDGHEYTAPVKFDRDVVMAILLYLVAFAVVAGIVALVLR